MRVQFFKQPLYVHESSLNIPKIFLQRHLTDVFEIKTLSVCKYRTKETLF